MILSKAGEHFSAAITHAFAGNGSAITVLATVGLALCWGAWRLWTFTIVPILRPDEPKELPYLIPCEFYTSCCTLGGGCGGGV